jgi:hypothetical protein
MFTITGDHLNEILRYPFTGKDWLVKIALQGAVLLILCPFLVGMPLLAGFICAHAKRGIDNSMDYPGWNEWGTYWKLGWKAIAVNLVYYLPILALIGMYVIVVLIPVLFGVVFESGELAAAAGIIGWVGMVSLYPLMFIYAIFYTAIQMATNAKIASGASINEALQWKSYIWPYIKYNALNLLILYLIAYLASMVSMVGMFFLFIGLFFTLPFALALMSYGHGVIYRLSAVK